MPDLFEIIDPLELTGYVRDALADLETNQFFFADALPTRLVDDVEAEFASGGLGFAEATVYRTFDAESPIGSRQGLTEKRITLPPVSRKIRLGEYDRLRSRRATPEQIAARVFDDAATMTRSVAARIELARSEVLYSGQIVFAENGVNQTVNFGRTGSHNASASAVWSNSSTATPITDLIACRDLIRDAGGEPGMTVMNSSVYAEMIATTQVKNLASSNGVNPSIVSDATLSAILAAHGLPPIKVYNAKVRSGGSTVKVLADDKVVMYDRDGLGNTWSGITAEQLELDALSSLEPGIVAVSTTTFDPVAVWTKAAAIALPGLANPDLSVGLAV